MNAQLSFLDGAYTLIHIPLSLYHSLLQPVLRVLLPQTQSLNASADPTQDAFNPAAPLEGLTSDWQHSFLNVSVTSLECSIVCHSAWARTVFETAVFRLPPEARAAVSSSADTYVIISIISAGLDAAKRVMDLSAPLALAGIPIFFIATYYSDFILVPSKERARVVSALAERGFGFYGSTAGPGYASSGPAAAATVTTTTAMHMSSLSSLSSLPLPLTSSSSSSSPVSSVAEAQSRAFELLRQRGVVPYIERELRLLQCSGREASQLGPEFAATPPPRQSTSRRGTGVDAAAAPGWIDNVDAKLYAGIVSALVSQPRFLSVTLAQEDPPSVLLDKALLPMFGGALVGNTDEAAELVPLFLDLESLPFEATGIVCGVAGRLSQYMEGEDSSQLSYLSTARSGVVIMSHDRAVKALDVLRLQLEGTG